MEPFPRTDLQDLSCSHEMPSLDSLSWNNFQKWSIGRNRMEEKKSRSRKKCHWSCFSFFYWLNFKVFSHILTNTKKGLETLCSDLPVELKHIGVYHRNTSVSSSWIGSHPEGCILTLPADTAGIWKDILCLLLNILCYYEPTLESFVLLINLILRNGTLHKGKWDFIFPAIECAHWLTIHFQICQASLAQCSKTVLHGREDGEEAIEHIASLWETAALHYKCMR